MTQLDSTCRSVVEQYKTKMWQKFRPNVLAQIEDFLETAEQKKKPLSEIFIPKITQMLINGQFDKMPALVENNLKELDINLSGIALPISLVDCNTVDNWIRITSMAALCLAHAGHVKYAFSLSRRCRIISAKTGFNANEETTYVIIQKSFGNGMR